MTMWKAAENGLAAAERGFLFAANGLLLGMLVINLANILSRLLFDKGIIWVFPWTGVMFVWSIFLAFYVIYRRGQDITIDILTRHLAQRPAAVVEILVSVGVLFLMGLLLAQVPVLVPKQVGRIDLVGLQRYWLSIPFFVSCALIALNFALRLRLALADYTHAGPESLK
jgi:TRAP-type C4-dicarboxylate transport system permease small subunit